MWRVSGEPRPMPMGAQVTYLRSSESAEGGHLVRFPDGRAVRVLPDGESTGQGRIRMISQALGELEGGYVDPVAYLRSRLDGCGLVEPADGTEEGDS